MLSRRGLLLAPLTLAAQPAPVRALTRGPHFHWFGYYDKLQFDPASRRVLGMQVRFEHRSPRPDDEIRLGVIDLEDHDRWTEIGATKAWNWQQGCMLQWVPGSDREVIWNTRNEREKRFESVVLDTKSGKKRVLPHPVYALSPDGRWAIYPDFRRLNDTRPGYGYAGLPDPNANVLEPKDAGLWRMDLATGRTELLLSFARIAALENPHEDMRGCKHWFNHLLYNTDGSRFTFLHRWRGERHKNSWSTRMITADQDGKDLFVIDPYGRTSHFIWRDPSHILAWAWHPSHKDAFYLLEDKTGKAEIVGKDAMTRNGHCTYLPGNRWILNDAYPDKERNQPLYLYEVATGHVVDLGRFHSPKEYTGEWRCDLHPRFSPDGNKITIDSPHGGGGRQIYLIDITGKTT
ncbi:MAG: PD40 domain-containing protein [Bryobacteraceae bacterium]|nr:PD40 domain-containing protein [Bryobacteraceae bacterium]